MICNTGSSNDDHLYAVLTLDLDSTLHLLKLIGIASVFKTTDSDFYRVSFWYHSLSYYSHWRPRRRKDWGLPTQEFDDLEEEIMSYDWVFLPPSAKMDREESPYTCGSANVGDEDIVFQCRYEDSSSETETPVLSKATLAEVANRLMILDVEQKAKAATETRGQRERVISLD